MAITAKELIEKKNSILDGFKQTLENLKGLQLEIAAQKKENLTQIEALSKENAALTQLEGTTSTSVKTMNKLLGLK